MGSKVFTNQAPATATVTLYARNGDDITSYAAAITANVAPGQQATIEYPQTFVNGFIITVPHGTDVYTSQGFSTKRGTQLDSMLNTNAKFTIALSNNGLAVTGHN
ncbi:MAG: hypothetical protein JWN15_2166 [Firmicutes bacterium]|nr:hypothetical protein [Bacillota bacterium]